MMKKKWWILGAIAVAGVFFFMSWWMNGSSTIIGIREGEILVSRLPKFSAGEWVAVTEGSLEDEKGEPMDFSELRLGQKVVRQKNAGFTVEAEAYEKKRRETYGSMTGLEYRQLCFGGSDYENIPGEAMTASVAQEQGYQYAGKVNSTEIYTYASTEGAAQNMEFGTEIWTREDTETLLIREPGTEMFYKLTKKRP